jgi:hypothetical protein
MRGTGAHYVSFVVYLLGLFTGFLYYGVSTLQDYSRFMCTKGMNEKMGIRKMMT